MLSWHNGSNTFDVFPPFIFYLEKKKIQEILLSSAIARDDAAAEKYPIMELRLGLGWAL